MDRRRGSHPWRDAFAIGLLLRPMLIVPMTPSGPLAGSSSQLAIALFAVFAFHVLLAAGAFVGNRPAIAFGILTGVVGVPLAAIGAYLGLPMPWPAALGGYNLALAALGIAAWREEAPAG